MFKKVSIQIVNINDLKCMLAGYAKMLQCMLMFLTHQVVNQYNKSYTLIFNKMNMCKSYLHSQAGHMTLGPLCAYDTQLCPSNY